MQVKQDRKGLTLAAGAGPAALVADRRATWLACRVSWPDAEGSLAATCSPCCSRPLARPPAVVVDSAPSQCRAFCSNVISRCTAP